MCEPNTYTFVFEQEESSQLTSNGSDKMDTDHKVRNKSTRKRLISFVVIIIINTCESWQHQCM